MALKSLISSFNRCSIIKYVKIFDQYKCTTGDVSSQARNISSVVNWSSFNNSERNLKDLYPLASYTCKRFVSMKNWMEWQHGTLCYPESENRMIDHCSQRLNYMKIHEEGMVNRKRKKKNPIGENKPYAKGVVLKLLVKKPKKPNSANRRCALVRLSNGKEMTAYIPGEGHNLQEHNMVLVRVGRLRDVPGVKLKCVRGQYDLGHVIKKN